MTPAAQSWVRRLWPAAAFQCAFIGAITLLKAAANALILTRFHPQALPYLYVMAAALTAAVASFAAVSAKRRRPSDPLYLALGGAVLSVAIGGVLVAGFSASALVLYLFAETFTTFVMIVFWSTMSDAFDARESRRAFTTLAGFGMSGSIVGGMLAQGLARWLGTVALIGGGAALLVLGAFAFRFHRVQAAHAAPPRQRHAAQVDVWGYLRKHRYPLALGGLVLAFSVITPVADFVFRQRAARMLGEDDLAALFGNLQLWMGLFCAVYQLFLAERLLAKLGILRYLAVIPALLSPFAIASVVSDALWPAYLLKLVESAVSLSILPVAVQLLYAPIRDDVRDQVRALMDGMVKKGGLAIGGLFLIGAGTFVAGPTPSLGLIALCATAGWALWKLRPAYVEALQDQVGDRTDPGEGPLDEASTDLLEATLKDPQPERVLHAVSLLEQGGVDLRPHVTLLMAHGSERVVERGVQLAMRLEALDTAGKLEELIGGNLRRPRTEAVWALAKLAPERAAELLPALREHPDPGVRCAALGALMQTASRAEAGKALEELLARGATAPVAERRERVKLLGRLGDEQYAPALAEALQDGDPSVHSLAMRAVGEGNFVSLAPNLLPYLTWRDERRVAREALAKLGDAVVPLLEDALNDRTRPAALRYELPRVLRELGTQSAFDALLFSNVRDDAFLHYRIGVAIARLKEDRPELEADVQRVREAIGRRRDIYRLLAEPYRDLRAALGEDALLTRAIGDRLDQAYEISFWLLGLLYPARTMRRIHQHLVGNDARRRAYALELMENLVEEDDRALVAEQMHGHHRDLPRGAERRLVDHLGILCHSDDSTLRACARHVARRHGIWTQPPGEDDMSDALLKRMFELEGVEIFAQSDVDDIGAVAAVAREVRFRAGEQIYDEGDPGDALYVIVKGTVEAYRKDDKVLTLRDHQQFGDVSLLDGSPRPTKMIAVEETHCLVIDRRDFLDLISDRPELLKGVFRAVSRQLRDFVDLAVLRKQVGDASAAKAS